MQDRSQIFWTAGFLNERFPAPISPLGWSVVGPLFEEYALRDPLRFMGYPGAERISATRLVRGHPYANVLLFQILYNPFPTAFLPADAVRYFPGGEVTWRQAAPYPRSILNPRFLSSMLAHFLLDPITWSPYNYWQWQRYTRLHDRRVAELNSRLDRSPETSEIIQVITDAKQADADLLKIHRWSLTYADLFFKWLTLLVGDSAQVLISDIPNLTQRANQDLWALARLAAKLGLRLDSEEAISAARKDPEFGRAVNEFTTCHGHRSFSLDIAERTFGEDPSLFLRLLQSPPELTPRTPQDAHMQRNATRSGLPAYERNIFDAVPRICAPLRVFA